MSTLASYRVVRSGVLWDDVEVSGREANTQELNLYCKAVALFPGSLRVTFSHVI